MKSLALLTSVGLVTACGGDVTRAEAFHPNRIFALGDQYSVITDTGKKYTINYTQGCSSGMVWVQALANNYGMAFSQCNPGNLALNAQMFAQAGAKVADVATQAQQAIAIGLNGKDIVTLFVGANDIIAAFENPALDEGVRTAQVQTAAIQLADIVNNVIGAGARVLFATVPDLGLSPYGRAQPERAQLSRLVAAFNTALRLHVQQDGRFAAIVLADSLVQNATDNPGSYLLYNTTDAACTVPTPDCTSDNLVSGSDPSRWLWAYGIDLAPTMQSRLGSLAILRAENNPF